jgi:SOS-response transcriptional repressor LexA
MSPPTTPPNFTPKQGQYLAFIYAYTHVLGRPPAEADLQRHFGVSPPSVHQMVLTLERTGLIRRKPGVARSVEVVVAPGPTSTQSQMIKTPVQRHQTVNRVVRQPDTLQTSIVPLLRRGIEKRPSAKDILVMGGDARAKQVRLFPLHAWH